MFKMTITLFIKMKILKQFDKYVWNRNMFNNIDSINFVIEIGPDK